MNKLIQFAYERRLWGLPDLEKAMQSHILAKAELIGTYQKSGKQ